MALKLFENKIPTSAIFIRETLKFVKASGEEVHHDVVITYADIESFTELDFSDKAQLEKFMKLLNLPEDWGLNEHHINAILFHMAEVIQKATPSIGANFKSVGNRKQRRSKK